MNASTSALISSSSAASTGSPISASISRWIRLSRAPEVWAMSARRWHSQSAMPASSHSGTTKYSNSTRVA